MLNAGAPGDATADRSPSPAYGLDEFGAAWSDAEGVLILVHGRDRAPDELAGLALGLPRLRRCRILAPHVLSRCWYLGRYDAPHGENAPQLDLAMSQVGTAFARAQEHGFGPDRVVLAGFSQGGCVVAEFLLAGQERPAGAAIFTGALPDLANRPEPGVTLDGLPVIVSGGINDPWLPLADLRATADRFRAAGADVRLKEFPDSEHVVRPRELALLDALVKPIAA